jgi:type III restriction enzyme
MTQLLPLKEYQQRSLDALRDYFRTCVQLDNADDAFYMTTRRLQGVGVPYQPARELSGLPYVCLRIPTGGGKTYVAAHAVPIAAKELLQTDHSVILWLTPSRAIRDQTLNHLKDRQHPYRRALESELGNVTVIEMNEALYMTRATLDASTVIIVSTIQASRVTDTDERKIYSDNGALMDHFSGYSEAALADLEKLEGNGRPLYSLANVLKLRRPIVIVDEAHNARTDLSFATLARFSPSCLIEFTATPDVKEHPSNVLYSVSAAELKAEDMIKLPIVLRTRPNWRELLADAIARLDQLTQQAQEEERNGGKYIRPIMLLQAQSRRKGNFLTVEKVKETLIGDYKIPANQIALATGKYKELDGVDVAAPDCPLRYIITVQALREGWDCPFAYVLCSVAEMRSSTAVEQILGRVMRLPYAQRKQHPDLNQAYAFAASTNFSETARSLVDGLVDNGFERLEASQMVKIEQSALDLDYGPLFAPPSDIQIVIAESIQLDQLPPETAAKIHLDENRGVITFTGPMNEADKTALQQQLTTAVEKEAVARAFKESHILYETHTHAERG